MSLLFPFARSGQPQQFAAPSGPFARGLIFAAIPGDRSIALSPAQPVVSGSSTVVVGRGGRGVRAPSTQVAGYVGYSSNLSIAASQDYTLAAFCIPSSGSTTGSTPTQDFIGAQTNFLSIASNGFRAQLDNNTTALNAYTKLDPALFMATRRGSTLSAYVPSGVVVTAATGTRAQTFTTICAGRFSGNNHPDTETYLLLAWNRGFLLDEYLALSKNVWQIFPAQPRRIWVPSPVTDTVITCTVGNASAIGPTARLNRAVKSTVGNAGAAGVTAALNRKIVTQVGNAVAAGVGASLSRRILTSPGDAQAAGVASQLARTIVTTPGDAACSGVQATISVAGATTITCTVGDATAAGVDAVLRRDVTITCTPGDAEAAGVPASVLAPTIISCTVGNAVAAGVTALLETSMTLTSADIAAIADAVWAHPKALTVQKFLGLK